MPPDLGHSYFLETHHHLGLLYRYATLKDRRALDPPPVTELQIFNVSDTGNGVVQETEVDYRWAKRESQSDYLTVPLVCRGLQPIGLICHVEVFQIPMAAEENPAQVTDFPTLPSANPSCALNAHPRDTVEFEPDNHR